MSKTKIVIIQLKEIVYTAIFVGLGILLILLLIFMFLPKSKDNKVAENESQYIPGVYTSQITIGDNSLNIEVVLDENHINAVTVSNLDDTITTMYPLVVPALETIQTQLCNNVTIDEVVISDDCKYTQMLLLDGVETAIEKAKVPES
ncbi:hypothetical protein [Anaeromicropila populeti]|uniref:FMN-binding domain-containing protein n=1 Tax=Anaeromicropila populeti TaxID=37658 RepID=A0A1I6HQ58_9FIRM|nr:hypothetical protein [Anaeromicropila populeti]SFR56497.1 hypothetical protein SAMN05661086_00157 [Anaeromicropila populeti]